MKLIVAIVQDEDAGRLVTALMDEGYGARDDRRLRGQYDASDRRR